jgi:hypothetical protein
MATPRKDYEHIKKTMGKRSAGEFVKASSRSDALARAKGDKPKPYKDAPGERSRPIYKDGKLVGKMMIKS